MKRLSFVLTVILLILLLAPGVVFAFPPWSPASGKIKGISSVDSIAALEAALEDGEVITLLPGSYEATATIDIDTDYVHIKAYGATISTATSVGNAPTLLVSGDGVTIEGLIVTGDATGWVRTNDLDTELRRNIKITGDDAKILDCQISEGVIGVEVDGTRATLSNNAISHSTVVSGYATNTNYCAGVLVVHTYAEILSNTITGYGQNILSGSGTTHLLVADNALSSADDNSVYGSSGNDAIIRHNTISSFDSSGIKMRGSRNRITDNSVTATTAAGGIVITGNGTPDANGINGENSVILNNTVSGGITIGIDVADHDGGYLDKFEITGNRVAVEGGTGIYAESRTTSAIINENIVTGHTAGIVVTAPVSYVAYDVTISGNDVQGGLGHNLQLQRVARCSVNENIIRNAAASSYGIRLVGVDDSFFIANDCQDTQGTPTQQSGILEYSTTCSNNMFINNIVDGNVIEAVWLSAGGGSQVVSDRVTSETLAGNRTMRTGVYGVYILDPDGTDRNLTWDSYQRGVGERVTIVNSGSANNLAFDSSVLNSTVSAGSSKTFIFDGSLWMEN